MEISDKKLYEALKTIQRVCEESGGGCNYCRLHDKDNKVLCGITSNDTIPFYWQLKKPEDWLAFKEGD